MQVIRNQIAIPVSQGKALLVHTLTGGMFVLGAAEYQILKNWVNKGEAVPQAPEEKTFYQLLQDNKFLTCSEEQEKALEQETLAQSRAQYRKAQESLDSVAFVLTYQCNFQCPYCYEGNGDCNISSQNRSIMTPEMVDAIFAIHQNKIKNIMLYGGEPLLPVNKETILHIISKAPNANFSATTNGYYLEEYFDIFSKLAINHLMVTLDGEETLHNKTRILHDGKGTYEKIMRGIDLYLRHDIRIKIRMNISKANVQSCLLVKKKLIEQYKDQHSRGLLLFEMQPIFQTTGKSLQELTQILYYPDAAENSEGGLKPLDARENIIARSLSPLVSIFSHPRKFVPKYCNCHAETNARFYDADGRIYSCILALNKEKASIGEYYPTLSMKNTGMHCRNIETISACRECKLRFLCGGGCGNAVIDDSGNVLRPNCAPIMGEIQNELPALYERYVKQQ